MGRVLFINGPLEGHVNPTLGLVRELVRRGEEVTYFTGEPLRSRVEATGAVVRTYDADQFSQVMRAGEVNHVVGVATGLLRTADVVIPGVLDQIRGEHFDYMIHDSMLGSGRLLAQLLNLPAISSSSTFARQQSTVNQMVEDLSARLSTEHYERVQREFQETARSIREKYEVAVDSIYEAYCNPAPLTVVYTSQYFQPDGAAFDGSYKFVGPTLTSRVQDPYDFSGVDADPLIYISLGTLFNRATDFYRLCFDALGETRYGVVLSIGRNTPRAELGPIPENFRVQEYVPQIQVLQHARLFVSHGGMNSVSESLFYGVPLIVFPQGADQHAIAARVAEMGAGVRLTQQEISAEGFLAQVEHLIDDTSVGVRCRQIGDSFRTAGGAVRAADEIFARMYAAE